MNKLINLKFLTRFGRLFLLGISVMVLFYGAQSGALGDFNQKGPQQTLAIEDDCLDPDQYGCPEPGDGGMVPEQPSCTETSREYPQCGGTVGLEGYPATDTIIVKEFTDSCSGSKRYEVVTNEGNLGQCAQEPAPAPQQPSCTETSREYPQCGGTVGLEGYPATDTIIVKEWANTCSGAKRYEVVTNKGNLGQCAQPAPAPQPVVTTTQLPECPKPGQSGTQQICGGQWAYDVCTITERFSDGTPAKYKCQYSQNANCVGTYSCPAPAPVVTTQACQIKTVKTEQTCIGAQLCTFNFQQQSDCSVVKKGPFNCFESTQCRAVVQPPVVVTPVIPVAQEAGPINVTNNNNNTNNNSNTNNNNISVNASGARETVREVQTVTAAAPTVVYAQQPAVAGVQVKELPKTGLPAAAWAALAFIPAGFRMRRFRKVQGELEDSPVYIWEKREYDANTYSHEQI